MKFSKLSKFSAGLLLGGLVASGLASPTPDTSLEKRATTLTRRAEKGVTDIAGQWVAWQAGYLSQSRLITRREPADC